MHCLYLVSFIDVVTRGGFSELDFSDLAGIGYNTVTLSSYDCVSWGPFILLRFFRNDRPRLFESSFFFFL